MVISERKSSTYWSTTELAHHRTGLSPARLQPRRRDHRGALGNWKNSQKFAIYPLPVNFPVALLQQTRREVEPSEGLEMIALRAMSGLNVAHQVTRSIAMSDVAHQNRSRTQWFVAAHLVARMLVWLGFGLAALGFGRTVLTVYEARSGIETLATIEAAAALIGGAGRVELSWQEPTGETRRAVGVGVSRALSRRLRIGSIMWREKLRIRYRPGLAASTPVRPVVVVDDVPEQVRSSASLAIGGFLAMTAGSALIMVLLLFGDARGRTAHFSDPQAPPS